MNVRKNNLKFWLAIVLVTAVLLRLLLFFTYPPVSYNDTASYRRSADAILSGLQAYDGTRTPGYPAFMALVGSDRAVYAAQLILGLGITMAWFVIGWKASGRFYFGAAAALAHTLNPGQFFFEANLLTETLSLFWLVLGLLGAFLWLNYKKYRSLWVGLAIGMFAALSALTRPLFIFMPVLLAVFLAFTFENKALKLDWKPLVGVLLPSILLLGGWMMWIQSRYHVSSLTTMTGFHLVQHTGYYFEDVPDEYADLRDVYLDYREARIEARGTQGNTIWDAIPAMQEETGMNFYELSRVLQKISIQLILTHPWQYLSRVIRGWWLFWRAPVYWNSSAITGAGLATLVNYLVQGARRLLFAANLAFIITSAAALISKRFRQTWALTCFHWLLAGSVWATSILSALIDHGDNPRFLVPLQSAVVFWVLWIGYTLWHDWQSKKVLPE